MASDRCCHARVPRHIVDHLSRLLAAHRRHIGTPRGSRALGPFYQAVLAYAGLANAAACTAWPAMPASPGHRYRHEGIDVLAVQAPDLHNVLDNCRREGMTHMILGGTLSLFNVPTDRVTAAKAIPGPRRQPHWPGAPSPEHRASPSRVAAEKAH